MICQVNIISIISKNLFRYIQLLQIDSEALHTISSLFASHSLNCLFYLESLTLLTCFSAHLTLGYPLCHAFLSSSVVSDSLCPHGLLPIRLLWQEAGVGCHLLLQGSSWPRNWTCISWISCIGRQILYHYVTWDISPILQEPVKSCFFEHGFFFFFWTEQHDSLDLISPTKDGAQAPAVKALSPPDNLPHTF